MSDRFDEELNNLWSETRGYLYDKKHEEKCTCYNNFCAVHDGGEDD